VQISCVGQAAVRRIVIDILLAKRGLFDRFMFWPGAGMSIIIVWTRGARMDSA
jgi:hypothetical protein